MFKNFTDVFLRFITHTIITRCSHKNASARSTRLIESDCQSALQSVFYSSQVAPSDSVIYSESIPFRNLAGPRKSEGSVYFFYD